MEAKYLQNNLAQLKKAISQDRLVIFAGAGVSFDSGLPLWSTLIEKIKKNLDFETNENDPLKIAQLLYNEKGEKEYNEILNSLIFESANTANSIHKILFKLNPQHIVTTNYDYFLEEVISQEGLPFSTISKDENLPYADHKSLLIKYHGDFENKNIVLKETDYLEFSKINVLKETFVKSLFSNKVILFVGYSFSDINLKILLRDVQYLLKKHQQKSYLITPKIDIPNSEKSYFNNFGINIINFDDALFEIDNSKNDLSKNGLKVYSILDYLINLKLFDHTYSVSNETSDINVIETAYQSLNRFKLFRVLPKRFIAQLYPFNLDSKQEFAYNLIEDRLLIFNENLYNSLRIKFEDLNINDDCNAKSSYIKLVFLLSGINEIAYVDRPTSHGQYIPKKDNIFEIPWSNDNQKCECFDCTIQRFEYKELLKKIKAYRISNSSDLSEDLKYAYTLYEIGDYLKSFHSFQNLLQKSNAKRRFDISYLAKFNLLHLSKFLHHSYISNDEIRNDEYESLKKIGELIDLDEELKKLKFYYDQDVYTFFKELNSGKSIHRLCIDLDTLKVTSLETLDRIKGGGSGGESFINLLNRIRELDNFLRLNHIIPENTYEVNHSFQKSIESIIIGYELKDIPHNDDGLNFGKPHIQWINYWICDIFIRRGVPDNLFKFLNKRIANNIELHRDDVNKLFNSISQFLQNPYNNNNYFGGKTDAANFINFLESKETFKRIISRQFFNICILLAYLDLDKKNFNRYVEPFNYFLEYIKFQPHSNSLKYIDLLIRKKGHLIEPKQIEVLLEIIYKTYKTNSTFFELLKFAGKTIKLDFLNTSDVDFNSYRFSSKLLFPLLNDQQKIDYVDRLKNETLNGDATYLFFDSINHHIIKDPEFIESYKTKINSILCLEHKDINRNTNYLNNSIHQFITLVFQEKINLEKIKLGEIKFEYYKFLFDGKNYPKDKFEIAWLKFKRNNIIDKQLSKNSYIFDIIEDHLKKNEDSEYENIYFHLKKL